jgi:hypothetical protein
VIPNKLKAGWARLQRWLRGLDRTPLAPNRSAAWPVRQVIDVDREAASAPPAEAAWLLTANIVQSRPWGPAGAEQRRGLKQFKPGAKVVVVKVWRNAFPEKVTVVGHQRHSKRYATVIINTSTLENLRVQLVRSPHILAQWRMTPVQRYGYGTGGREAAEAVLQVAAAHLAAHPATSGGPFTAG